MRIAYITYEYPPDISAGGIATYVYEAARFMKHKGLDVEIFCGSFDREIVLEEDGILVHRILVTNVDDFAVKVADTFVRRHNENKFDLFETPEINANGQYIHERLPQLPFITRLHMPVALQLRLFNYYQPFLQKLRFVAGAFIRGRFDLGFWRKTDANRESDRDYRITNAATLITAPSVAMKKWAVQYWKIAPERIVVTANPYTPSPILLNQTYSFKQRNYLTFIGKLNVHKGMVSFTKALPHILDQHPSLKVMLIGNDGPSHIKGKSMRCFMEEQLVKYKDRVVFKGAVALHEIPDYLALSKVCIFPSIWEAFGYVALEAMSAGVPVIVSDGSGLAEVAGEGKYGVLIDALKPGNMVTTVSALLNDEERCIYLSEQGRMRAKEYDMYSTLPDQFIAIYKKALANNESRILQHVG